MAISMPAVAAMPAVAKWTGVLAAVNTERQRVVNGQVAVMEMMRRVLEAPVVVMAHTLPMVAGGLSLAAAQSEPQEQLHYPRCH